MSEEKIGIYTTEEIYEELANGFLHRSMVDAMYFQIKDLQQKVEQLEKEKNTLMYSLTLVRQKWNNDKSRYRRKAKVYREQRNQLENKRKEAIEIVNQYMPNYASCVKALDELENILNKGSESDE